MLRPKLLAASALAALSILPNSGFAQEHGGQRSQPAIDEVKTREPELVSVKFNGGTVTEFVALVRMAADQRWKRHINLLVTGPAGEAELPAIEIHDSELANLFSALDALVAPVYSISFDSLEGDGEGTPIQLVRVQHNTDSDEAIQMSRRVRVFPLRALTSSLEGETSSIALKPETVLTAVETALGLCTSTNSKPVIRFHEDSGLMLVQGTEMQLSIAEEIVDRLTEDTNALRARETMLRGRRAVPDSPSPPGPSGPARMTTSDPQPAGTSGPSGPTSRGR